MIGVRLYPVYKRMRLLNGQKWKQDQFAMLHTFIAYSIQKYMF